MYIHYMRTNTLLHVYAHTYIYMFIQTFVCISIYIHTHIHIYTITYAYIHITCQVPLCILILAETPWQPAPGSLEEAQGAWDETGSRRRALQVPAGRAFVWSGFFVYIHIYLSMYIYICLSLSLSLFIYMCIHQYTYNRGAWG